MLDAATIVGVDLVDRKLDYARQFGATHVLNPVRDDVTKAVRGLTGGRGADYAFEVIGLGRTIEQAYGLTRSGGTTVVVGAAGRDETVTLPAWSFLGEKVLKGSVYGSARPHTWTSRASSTST